MWIIFFIEPPYTYWTLSKGRPHLSSSCITVSCTSALQVQPLDIYFFSLHSLMLWSSVFVLSWSWFLSLWFDVFLLELFLAWLWDLGVLVWCLCPSLFYDYILHCKLIINPDVLLNQFLTLMDFWWAEFWDGLNWECLFLL